MKAALDTNILVRIVMQDDEKQANAAIKLLRNSEAVSVSISALCEFVWVLRSVYGFSATKLAQAVEALIYIENVVLNLPAAEAGLDMLKAGGDFADGVIMYEGSRLGGEVFISFDKKATQLAAMLGIKAELLR